ncbi:MAG: hypothetical protein WKF78_08760 [Candidatus Limnocylindrales bacterium]
MTEPSSQGGDVDTIVSVRVATVLHELEVPIVFGSWVMRHREFALVRIDAESGLRGFAYCLTRDGPLAALVGRTIAPAYSGSAGGRPERRVPRCPVERTTRSMPPVSGCAPCPWWTSRPGIWRPRRPVGT